MDSDKTELGRIASKLDNKYIGIEPMLLIAIIAVIIIYYYLFSSLGNNADSSSSSIKVFIESLLWFIFVILLLLNGILYIFGIDVLKTLNGVVISNTETDTGSKETDITINLRERNQVFNLPEKKYSYEDANAVCQAYDARLATYDDVSNAYDKGADWCGYGWSADQMVLFPTQREKWEKLQKRKGHEKECGHPGVNGGYVYDITKNYGVNCYGPKPNITPDKAANMRNTPIYQKNKNELKFDEKVNYWRSKLAQIEMAPFNHDSWSML